MADSVQPLIIFAATDRTPYSGIQSADLGVTFGAGVLSPMITLVNQQYVRLQR
ncbi:hypothetical protein LCGC14_2875360, partial [marine sediment metagenome]